MRDLIATMAGPSTSCDTGTDERRDRTRRIWRESSTFVWENIYSFPASQDTFCNVYGPQFYTAELHVVSAFENIFDIALVQLIVDETNTYAQQEISKKKK
jgi:hypothetical protein